MKGLIDTYLLAIRLISLSLLFLLLLNATSYSQGQEKQVIQIKAFDEALKPFGNIQLGINQGDLIKLNARGTAFANLKKDDFPIKSIAIGDNTLEAASWNLSKGVLEVTIRNKSYRDIVVVLKDADNKKLGRQAFTFKGAKTITSTTDLTGTASLPLALNETITDPNQFVVRGFQTTGIEVNGSIYEVTVATLNPTQNSELNMVEEVQVSKDLSPDLESSLLSSLDSVGSLSELYNLLKDVRMNEFSEDARNRIDLKFDELLAAVEGSEPDSTSFITYITDSTVVENDLKNLLNEVKRESKRINSQKSEFDSKINLVREKLNVGFENLNDNARQELLSDLNLLEELLASNEYDFTENQSSYKAMITDLKNRFFDLEKLEGQLSISEQKRLEEQRIYKQRILAISALVLVFALLLIVLLYLRVKLKKQKKQLVIANASVQDINQNLESIVSQRTQLLEKTFKELDMVLYRASHDLRAPLCSITGLSNLISLNSEDEELTDLIVKTNNKMDRLLRKLSTISEIHQPGKFSEVRVADLSEEVLKRFETVIKQYGVEVSIDYDQDLTIVSIPFLIEVTLQSLLENALFFASIKQDQKGIVQIKISRIDNRVEIEVYDNGIGIDKSSVEQLFDMFYIGTEFSKGNGLGLYIVQKSVNVLKGKITIDSEYGEYTRVIVSVPIDDSFGHTLDFLDQNTLLYN